MKIKQTIFIIIVIAALAGAGVFAYMSFAGGDKSASVTAEVVPTAIILPHGSTLDFEKINKFNETGREFQYPKSTPIDIGLQLNEIISQ